MFILKRMKQKNFVKIITKTWKNISKAVIFNITFKLFLKKWGE